MAFTTRKQGQFYSAKLDMLEKLFVPDEKNSSDRSKEIIHDKTILLIDNFLLLLCLGFNWKLSKYKRITDRKCTKEQLFCR